MNTKLKFKIFEKFRTQADFALALKTNESIVSKVIRGRRKLPEAEKVRWAKALDCEPEEIFND